mmetsp:Transcript_1778/g.5704  ORF Transcript_1778/g.5704 Transcript_1778/m.5704 type:complete len:216 (+) Transcript_1778:801-1448(+)
MVSASWRRSSPALKMTSIGAALASAERSDRKIGEVKESTTRHPSMSKSHTATRGLVTSHMDRFAPENSSVDTLTRAPRRYAVRAATVDSSGRLLRARRCTSHATRATSRSKTTSFSISSRKSTPTPRSTASSTSATRSAPLRSLAASSPTSMAHSARSTQNRECPTTIRDRAARSTKKRARAESRYASCLRAATNGNMYKSRICRDDSARKIDTA